MQQQRPIKVIGRSRRGTLRVRKIPCKCELYYYSRSKLCDHEVEDIRKLASRGWKQNAIAEAFSICQGHVSGIVHYLVRC